MPVAIAPTGKEIPYDYVAKFTLKGIRGNREQDVINISVEGAFVAVAIGYSFIPARLQALTRPPEKLLDLINRLIDSPVATQTANALKTNFNLLTAHQLVNISQAIAPTLGQIVQIIVHTISQTTSQTTVDPLMVLQCLLVRLCGIDFKYSIIDSGTGRELQNQPIHNLAGLGEPTGDRPFRPLAKPMLFMPRSTIRIEVEEVSEGPIIYGYDDRAGRRVGAELFIVLHGYKILGYGTGQP
jgi:hypothetical protein